VGAVEEFLANLPKLHYWGGKPEVGGLTPALGDLIVALLSELKRSEPLSIVETGAGATTLLFLCLAPEQLLSIAPDASLGDRIVREADMRGIERRPLRFICERSERALPRLVEAGHSVNVALIDGNHGWPSVFVDFCYLNQMLGKGGILILDDLQLYSVLQLFLLLRHQPGFEPVARVGKLAAFRKTDDVPFLPEFHSEPFIVANTAELPPSMEFGRPVDERETP
jgi:hypothetical protein